MNYKRKTRHKWASDALILLGLIAGFLLGAFVNNLIKDAYANEPMLSPIPDTITIEIEKEIIVETIPTEVEDIIKDVFGEDANDAIMVAFCESSLSPGKRNKESTATGLFQIMASVHGVRRDWLEDPVINTRIAKSLFDASGWNPWLASNHCHKLLGDN